MMSPQGTTHTAAQHTPEERELFLQDFREGGIGRDWADGHRIFEYDPAEYPFATHIRRMLVEKGVLTAAQSAGLARLEDLHTLLPESLRTLDASEINEVSKQFYDQDSAFRKTYEAFYKKYVREKIAGGAEFLFQTTPTIRFHFPHQKGFNWLPRFHTDIMLGHPPQEVNLWLPATQVFESNSMLLMGRTKSLEILDDVEMDLGGFARRVQDDPELQARCRAASEPVTLRCGQLVAFDSRCLHATQFNTTSSTRISLDFRFLPVAEYRKLRITYRGTGRRQMLFQPGEYYDPRTSAELS